MVDRFLKKLMLFFENGAGINGVYENFFKEHLFITLYNKAFLAMAAILSLATIIFYISYKAKVNISLISAWYILVLWLASFHFYESIKIKKNRFNFERVYALFRIEVVLMALLWSFCSLFLYPSGNIYFETAFIVSIVMLFSVGAINFSVDKALAKLFVLLIAVSLSIRVALEGDSYSFIAAVSILVYSYFLMMGIKQIEIILEKGVEQSKELALLQNRMRMVVEQAPMGIFSFDKNFKVQECNNAILELLDIDKEAAIGFDLDIIKNKTLKEKFKNALLFKKTQFYNGAYRSILSGKKIWVSVAIAPLVDASKEVVGGIAVVQDRSLEHKAMKKAEFLAYHDPLTSLPNRKLLGDRYETQIAQAKRKKLYSSLLFLDLDRFKQINDTFGHNVGDELLKESSQRLLNIMRKGDTVCRLGGDEFIVFLPMISKDLSLSINHTLLISKKIHKALSQPFFIQKNRFNISTSIGAVLIGTRGESLEEVLRCADIAMYHAKKLGRGVTSFYEEFMDEQVKKSIRVEKELRSAIKKGELKLYFQPIVDSMSGKIVGAEALLRWLHPSGAVMMPSEFISIAEESDLICKIGELVVKEACRVLSYCEAEKKKIDYISVNISPAHFKFSDFFDQISKIIKNSDISTSKIKFEITENVLIENSDLAKKVINRFKEIGIGFMIDDFGTGYSSLSYLKNFYFEAIKIDKIFIKDLLISKDDRALVKAILKTARQFSCYVVAEGVETREQKELLKKIEPNIFYQGYLFSAPLDESEFLKKL